MNTATAQELKDKARVFFSEAETFPGTARHRFADSCGESGKLVSQVLPKDDWSVLQKEWALERIRRAMDESFAEANTRWDFSISNILARLHGTGIRHAKFRRLAGEEWEKRRLDLPTPREKVMLTIRRLVAERASRSRLTWENVLEEAGTAPAFGPWLGDALRQARRELLRSGESQPTPVPDGVNALILPNGWIDLDADVWDMRGKGGVCLSRSALRRDLADIAWSLLREAALADHLSFSTVGEYFRGYKWAGEVLGKEVPDVTKATLGKVQRAWLAFKARPAKRNSARYALVRLFSRLTDLSKERNNINGRNMLLIAAWLSVKAHVPRTEPNADYLSESEVDAVVAACLSDVKAGIDFLQEGPDLLSLSTWSRTKGGAAPVVRMAVALKLLLMLFTGLRAQSVMKLKTDDWTELRPGMYALVWRHGKKREEKVAVLPASIALLLDFYTRQTQVLRQALGTNRVFISASQYGYWQTERRSYSITESLQNFIKRHGIFRDGKPIKLTCQMLRRTFVTRELYEGRSIWALRLQLGHRHLESTKRYGKFDRYEHPSQVGSALDAYGRKALTLWHHPIILGELDSAERESLLEVRQERDQGVGLCRHGSCVKIVEGSLLPCSMCEHLVTGRDFFYEWDKEKAWREQKIAGLESTPERSGHIVHERQQYAMFMANYDYLRGEAE